jgi:hypothetical protein
MYSLFAMVNKTVFPLPPPPPPPPPQRAKQLEPGPFSTQSALLMKYAADPETDPGLCRSLSNVYATEVLQGRDPSLLLANDRHVMAAAINEENVEYRLQREGLTETHVSYLAFTLYSTTPPATGIVQAGKMHDVLDEVLKTNDHVLLVVPTEDKGKHEVYFGRDNVNYSRSKTQCRFFDANLEGGERTAPCSVLISKFKQHIELNYPINSDDGHFSAIPHPRKP